MFGYYLIIGFLIGVVLMLNRNRVVRVLASCPVFDGSNSDNHICLFTFE